MAYTKLNELYTNVAGAEEIFNDYVIARIMEKSAFFRSGVVSPMAALVPTKGTFMHFPYWNELSGDSEVLSDATGLTINALTAGQQIAPVLGRGKGFGVNDLVNFVSGDDPLRSLANLVGDYWVREYDRAVIATVDGSADGVESALGSIINDQSTASIDAAMSYDTMALLGEYSSDISAVIMHSAIHNSLNKDDLIATEFPSANTPVTTYLGKQVIIDDRITNAGGVYNTYFCKAGTVGFADGTPAEVALEFDRNIATGNNEMTTRRRFVMHAMGSSWTAAATATELGYDNAALATGTNWDAAFTDPKKYGIRILKSLV